MHLMTPRLPTVIVCVFLAGLAATGPATGMCPDLALQVLGSGGPIADDARASSAYVLWRDNQPLLMVDAGGGVHLRAAQANVDLAAIDAIHLTHMHADHASGLPALLKSAWFVRKDRDLLISGPGQGARFPGVDEFVDTLLNGKTGLFRYLSEYREVGDPFRVITLELDHRVQRLQPVTANAGVRVEAAGVDHGPVPAVAYRIEIDDRIVAVSGDQTGLTTGMLAVARNADLLVINAAIPRNAGKTARNLHATPAQIGTLAARAGVKALVISHLMQRTLRDLDGVLSTIRSRYDGPLEVAEDLMCVTVAQRDTAIK